jgi:CRP-like cAMP-binding protein
VFEEQALEYLRRLGEEVVFTEGETVLRQGGTGAAFWVILQGEVEVVLRSSEGADHRLLRLGPGETFGELAILRSAPIAADVVAVTSVTLLRYPGEYLPTALAECEPLRRSLLARMAHSVLRRTSETVGLYKQTRALADLHQGRFSADAMISNSARMRTVVARIKRAAASREPVLITGESGTGKLLAARRIHVESVREKEPLIAVDCGELSARDANTLIFGTSSASNADLSAERYGAMHLAHGGTLVLRNIEALNDESRRELARHLQSDREVESTPFPDVRVIATIDINASGPEQSKLAGELAEQFRIAIEMPTLAERPRDIVPLARTFLGETDGSGRLQLTPSAERALVSLKYRHRNVEELRSVVELAARVADGDELRAEHIFSGFDGERPIGLDISRFWFVRWLVDGGGLQFSRLVVALGFVAAAIVCLAASGSVVARIANGAVWKLWEPVVFGLFLLVGSL